MAPSGPHTVLALDARRGPALEVPDDQLGRALSCPVSFSLAHDPVLLVHGVTQTADETWDWSYAKVLRWAGFDVCTVALPDFGRGDIQVQTQYVVHAIEAMGHRTGRSIDVVTHSLGAIPARSAVKWWPGARALVDDMILIAAMNHGNVHDLWLCALECVPSAWQSKPGSQFLESLNAGDETPGEISYTSVYSLTDLAVPELPGNATSTLSGAANVAIQDLCLLRLVDHPQTVSDAAVFAVVADALRHPGPADPARIDRSVCLQATARGIDSVRALTYEATWYRDLTIRLQEHKTPGEPPVAAWATS